MKSMKNFQLIVITHDECKFVASEGDGGTGWLTANISLTAFLQRLAGNSNAFEYYWLVGLSQSCRTATY